MAVRAASTASTRRSVDSAEVVRASRSMSALASTLTSATSDAQLHDEDVAIEGDEVDEGAVEGVADSAGPAAFLVVCKGFEGTGRPTSSTSELAWVTDDELQTRSLLLLAVGVRGLGVGLRDVDEVGRSDDAAADGLHLRRHAQHVRPAQSRRPRPWPGHGHVRRDRGSPGR